MTKPTQPSADQRSAAPESRNTPQWRVSPAPDDRGNDAERRPVLPRDRRWWAVFLGLLNLILEQAQGGVLGRFGESTARRVTPSDRPAVTFDDVAGIDEAKLELDAVGRSRWGSGSSGGGNDEREQTLNQILTEMDGFEADTDVIVLAATNRPEVLDQALLRPGRFDRRIAVQAPDRDGRVEILRIHTRSVPLADDVDLGQIAASTPGATGADLALIVNEAALFAARRAHDEVRRRDLTDAIEIARGMVARWGMSETIGPLAVGEGRENGAYRIAGIALPGDVATDHKAPASTGDAGGERVPAHA